jgi:DNA-binding transcriptional MerR regulator
MDSDVKLVVTAIRDMEQEGFIAASLRRSGWKVIYRATSVTGLREKLNENPTALLLSSDDFGDISEIHQGPVIQLRGRSHPLAASSPLNPQSDLELAEIIRAQASTIQSRHISATSAKVIAISSIGGRTGATIAAITIAEQIAQAGRKVLLVDGNRLHPKIAHHFQEHNIRGEIKETQYGFSISEVTDIQSLNLMASQANHFQSIILDMGSTSAARDGGQRVADLALTWAINSQASEIITARDDDFSLDQIKRYLAHERRALREGGTSIFLTPSKVLSRRERKEVIGGRSKLLATEVEILTRDLRSIEKMENSHSTLNFSSPSSPFIGDIARYLERGRYS